MTLYMLQLDTPLGNENHSASLYLGYTKNLKTLVKRIDYHRKGQGATFTKRAVEKGINLKVVLVIDGDRSLERKIKNQKNHRRFLNKMLKEIYNDTTILNNLLKVLEVCNHVA